MATKRRKPTAGRAATPSTSSSSGTGLAMLRAAAIDEPAGSVPEFMTAIAAHRDWGREERAQQIPA